MSKILLTIFALTILQVPSFRVKLANLSGDVDGVVVNEDGWNERAGDGKNTLILTLRDANMTQPVSRDANLWSINAWTPFVGRRMRLTHFAILHSSLTNIGMKLLTKLKKPTFVFDVGSYEETIGSIHVTYVIGAYISEQKRVICVPSGGETCQQGDEFALTSVQHVGDNFIEYIYDSDECGGKGVFQVRLELDD